MKFVKDLYRDEIRSDFLVTTDRKKLWNVQIELINEVDRICRKYDLKWFAHGGTLLGAVRHGGFIPWDDDVDLIMLRPDYNRFMEVAPAELPPRLFLDNWCNHRLEEEEASIDKDRSLTRVRNLTIKLIRQHNWYWPINASYAKLRDSSTTMIQWPERRRINQGIWIDIFPVDPMPPFDEPEQQHNFDVSRELMLMTWNRPKLLKMIKDGEKFETPLERLKELSERPFRDRARAFEAHQLKSFSRSEKVSCLPIFLKRGKTLPRSVFDETIELPFELATVCAPADYDSMLTAWYGDWHKVVFQKGHVTYFSADISYKDYFAKVKRV